MRQNICIVFVCNKAYFNKFIKTCKQLITNGKYIGNICLVIGQDLNNNLVFKCDFIKENNIIIKYFPDIKFPDSFHSINNNINSRGDLHINKKFQWHKLHLFNTFFKKWNYIFYLDCGMKILSDVSPMINEGQNKKNTYSLLAHSDAYPSYEWKLHTQFDKTQECFVELNNTYNLNIDYFQTGMMLYNTDIIKHDTYKNLFNLSIKYPISVTNEQGIMALYFTNIEPLFIQIKMHNEYTYFYDSTRRNKNNKYIMFKSD